MYTIYIYAKDNTEPLAKSVAFTWQEAIAQAKEDIQLGYVVKIYDGLILVKQFN